MSISPGGLSDGSFVVYDVLTGFFSFSSLRSFWALYSLTDLLLACFYNISAYKRLSSSICRVRSSFTWLNFFTASLSLAFNYCILLRMYSCTLLRCIFSYSLISSLRLRLRLLSSRLSCDKLLSISSRCSFVSL